MKPVIPALVLLPYVCVVVSQIGVSQFEYHYSVNRNKLKEDEQLLEGYKEDYTEDEQIVHNVLEYLKWEEFERTRDNFPPARPVKLNINDVKNSRVYKVLKRFPKGGNMHLHHDHIVSKSKVLDIVMNSPVFNNLYVKADPGQWRLDFFTSPPAGWEKVKDNPDYTTDVLLKHATFLNTMSDETMFNPTNADKRWEEFSKLFGVIGSNIVNQANISKLYMEAILQSALDENVQYLETKSSAKNKLYVLDRDDQYKMNNGKRFIDNYYGERELQQLNETVHKFKKDNPLFIGCKRIITANRMMGTLNVGNAIEKALELHNMYPDLVAGFDLVEEEDKGHSLLFFLKDFATVSTLDLSLPYYFHTGETNWPEDLLTTSKADDPVATIENVYDAILLGARRVGHGMGYVKHPYLMEILREKQIAVEVNPISNRMLGYVSDQRHHPGITYMRYGIPVVLGADDPATLGYDEFTADWYEVFMGWGINLADMRQLARNSLLYSSLSDTEKGIAVDKWKRAWDVFVAETKDYACVERFENIDPHVFSVLPKIGHLNGGTKIQVFGRNFQVAICKQIKCRFGDKITPGKYVYNHIIECYSPPFSFLERDTTDVTFAISLDGGETYLETRSIFSYLIY